MIIERIQYPSFATFWKQMEGKLASGSCISGNFHPDIFIRAADNVESPRTPAVEQNDFAAEAGEMENHSRFLSPSFLLLFSMKYKQLVKP